ncbi:ATP-binding cassette domain-containing protein [Marinilabilia salmonicolor]|jgi:polar amino acid transport system ATP-binding protein/putative ABC transport system ATP-binding protein|uniref:Amino acid ABC transporter ATP-binding protein (PAAT family) n=1 Tax=Marinilabilia salmonicolor TaxID=989 RepID=A0A2T0XN03_9BACT|nr:ABC transporter ATP-binding protein [Marinilabilia salmonicolor]PRZ00320.1 amino acid ABC transporter ATP-binding protein (PAAT family) [Marinilabilia salmonicolor]RCW26077.1 amino acid ABC transporter ATP-binding protein (PAAT family) [Marinilabilia salmonicolor]
MISFDNVTLKYSTGTIFENLSFSVQAGSKVCITGHSGTGKSSVLKIIQGYVKPHSGSVQVGGMKLGRDTVKDIRSQIAYVPQNINLPVSNGDELTRMLNVSSKRRDVELLMGQLGLEKEMFVRPFDEMSGGQKQRVVIAVCLSLDRDIVLLDEPTSSLDDDAILKLLKVVSGLKDKTVISSSHHHEWGAAMEQEVRLGVQG